MRTGINPWRRHTCSQRVGNGDIHCRRLIIFGEVFYGRSGALLSLVLLLQIVHLAEEIVLRLLQFHRGDVRDTQQFKRILEHPAFDILVADATDVDVAVYAFKVAGGVAIVIGIGQCRDGDLHPKKLGFIVFVPVEASLEPGLGLLLPVLGQQLVTVPVEEEDSHEQYGSEALQSATN